jgi:predicted Rossmann fold nucleotide-binding protein DprA/Smf involved in DNA uptake
MTGHQTMRRLLERRTIAVMGTGLDHVYPAASRPMAARIVDSGCALVTPFFPHQTPRPWTFPARNVVMSGLSLATVVVEASETSGARMQARVRWADLDPARGREQAGQRPVLVLSDDAFNER